VKDKFALKIYRPSGACRRGLDTGGLRAPATIGLARRANSRNDFDRGLIFWDISNSAGYFVFLTNSTPQISPAAESLGRSGEELGIRWPMLYWSMAK